MNETPSALPPSTPAPPRADFDFSPAGLRRIGRLIRKELTEILRDRRTILTLVLMPALLYPLLTVAFQQYFLSTQPTLLYFAGFRSERERLLFENIMHAGSELLEKQASPAAAAKDERKTLALQKESLKCDVFYDLEKQVKERKVDIGIVIDNYDDVRRGKTRVLATVAQFVPNNPHAAAALGYINRRFSALNLNALEQLVAQEPHGPGPPALKLRRVELKALTSGDGTISLAALVPFILILMTITGAVYPAIDLTAGERERGTMEILVAAPVPRLGLLFAKYVAVLTVAIMTALINLTAMYLTLQFSGWGHKLLGEQGLSLPGLLALLGLLILFAALFSAVLLILTSFARSFKEAQAYLIPLMLASLGPGLAGVIPGLKLSLEMAVTPLINIVLLARDIFEDKADPAMALVVTLSTLSYAGVAIALAARIFGAEEVLYNEQSSWSDLWRRPRQLSDTASMSGALVCLAMMVPVGFALLGIVQRISPTPEGILTAQIVIYILLFVLMPLAVGGWSRVNLRTGFSLTKAPWLSYAGALVLGLTLWPIVMKLGFYLHAEPSEFVKEQTEKLAQAMREAGGLFAASLAVAAITEEFFFRGYLLNALLRGMRPMGAIALSAFLFGFMHGILGGGIGFEQILPATLLGLLLGAIRWRTGSVLPGMVVHLVHNVVLAVILVRFTGAGENTWNDEVPPMYLAASLICAPLGAAMVWWKRRKPPAIG